MRPEYTFRLTGSENVKQFQFTKPNSFLVIKKIIIESLWGREANEWFKQMVDEDIKLKISFIKSGGTKFEFPLDLVSYVSPYHRQPVFEFNDFIIPEQNRQNSAGLIPHFVFGKIELISKSRSTNLQVRFICELSPGTIEYYER